MSVVYSQTMISPANKSEECAVFTIADAREAFTFTDVTNEYEEYTLSFWIKADTPGTVKFNDTDVSVTSDWTEHAMTFIAHSSDLVLDFDTAGNYYIYHLQLEVGNMATDWTVAPEDVDDSIDDVRRSVAELVIDTDSIRASVRSLDTSLSGTKQDLSELKDTTEVIRESVSELAINTDSVHASVSSLEAGLNGTKKDISELILEKDSIVSRVSSLDDGLKTVNSDVTQLKQTSENFTFEIQKFNTDGVNRVSTTTGVFDDAGLTIDKSDSQSKTQITPEGMIVYGKDANGTLQALLTIDGYGDDAGVYAKNLYAETYLKIGGRSRFENYGTNRTGCFWIGG